MSLARRRTSRRKKGRRRNRLGKSDEEEEQEGGGGDGGEDAEDGSDGGGDDHLVPDVRSVPWFDSPSLRPRCLCLSAGEDFLAVAAASGELFVAPTELLAPGFSAKGGTRRPHVPHGLFEFSCFR